MVGFFFFEVNPVLPGFFIPIEMVMPRVTTGFISFLSLQVFRCKLGGDEMR